MKISNYIKTVLLAFVVISLAYYFTVYRSAKEKGTWHELKRLHAKQNINELGGEILYSVKEITQLKHGVLLVSNKERTLVYLGSLTLGGKLYRYPINGGIGDCVMLKEFISNVAASDIVKNALLKYCEETG